MRSITNYDFAATFLNLNAQLLYTLPNEGPIGYMASATLLLQTKHH